MCLTSEPRRPNRIQSHEQIQSQLTGRLNRQLTGYFHTSDRDGKKPTRDSMQQLNKLFGNYLIKNRS